MKRYMLLGMLIGAIGVTLILGWSRVETSFADVVKVTGLSSVVDMLAPAGSTPISGEEEGVITSEGKGYLIEGRATSGGEGVIPGGGGPATPEEPTIVVSQWALYQNATYGYEILYPPAYIMLPEAIVLAGISEQKPRPVNAVWFQDRELAESATASMEPPKLSIEVFDNRAQLPVEQWLEDNRLLAGFEVEPYTLAGVKGLRLYTMLLLAPNEFIYLAKGDYVFKLTPLGNYAPHMMESLSFK